MIQSINNKVVLATGFLLQATCIIASIYTNNIFISFLPAAFLLALLSFQYPRVLFYCLVAAIPWSIEYNISSTLGTDVPDELLMWLTTFVTIAWIILNYKRVFKKLQLHPLMVLLLIQLSWTIVTVLFSTYPLLSLKFIIAKTWFVLPFVVFPVLFFQKKEIKITAIVLAASMMAITTIALVRHALLGFTFAEVNNSIAPFFRNHVNYSALLVCIIPLLFVFAFSIKNKKAKGFLKCCLTIALAALYLSYSRGAWMALIVGAAAYFLIRKGFLLKGFLISLVICVSAFFWLQHQNNFLKFAHDYKTTIFHTNFEEHLVATYQLKDVSTAERFYRWVGGVRMIKYNALTGYGPNTFYNNYKGYTGYNMFNRQLKPERCVVSKDE